MPLQVTPEALASVIHTCTQFCREMDGYYQSSLEPPVSLDEIVEAVERKFGVTVEVWNLEVESKYVHGMVEIWGDRVIIFVDSAKPESMRRYVVAKELVQRIIWTPESCTENPPILLELLVQRHLFAGNVAEIPKDAVSDTLAMFGAIELLFPLAHRYTAKQRLFRKEATIYSIADEIRMPAYIVEFALSDRYLGLCQHINGDSAL